LNNMKVSRLAIVQTVFSLSVMLLFYADLGLKFNQVVLAVVFIECAVVSMKDRFFNVYQIFLLMMFFFNLSIPFFNLFGLYDYPDDNMFNYSAGIRVAISTSSLQQTYAVLTILLLGTSVGWLLNKNQAAKKTGFCTNETASFHLGNWIWVRRLFLLILPFEFLYEIILVRFAMENGYVATMHLHSYLDSISKILVYIDYIYPFAGLMALFICRDKKDYFKYATLYLLPYVVQLFTGLRGNMISILLAVLFLYSWNYRQIKIREAVSAFVILFIAIISIGAVRFSHDVNDISRVFSGGLTKAIIDEICSNGESIAVLSYTIQLLESFTNKVPFLFGYIFAIFSFSSNYSIDGIMNKSYLAQHITYLLNSSKLLGGSTIGTAISAEFYEFGQGNYLVVFILSILLLMIANLFIRKMYKNPMWFYFAVSYIQNLFLSPRGSVMKIFSKLSLAYIVIFIFLSIFFRKRGTDNEY